MYLPRNAARRIDTPGDRLQLTFTLLISAGELAGFQCSSRRQVDKHLEIKEWEYIVESRMVGDGPRAGGSRDPRRRIRKGPSTATTLWKERESLLSASSPATHTQIGIDWA